MFADMVKRQRQSIISMQTKAGTVNDHIDIGAIGLRQWLGRYSSKTKLFDQQISQIAGLVQIAVSNCQMSNAGLA